MAPPSLVDNQQSLPNWSTPFRILSLTLALGFWCFYIGRYPFSPSSSWRYLTNWGLSLNLLVALWAVLGLFSSRLRRHNPLLPTALTASTLVVLLYWGLYAINPAMVTIKAPLPWYSNLYMHLGTTVLVYLEAFLLNDAPRQRFKTLAPIALVGIAYVLWVDLVVATHNTTPCGLTTSVCGYPYPFLNDFTPSGRWGFYTITGALVLRMSLCILSLWRRAKATQQASQ